MMAACGARYAALLRTSLGTTPDDPTWGDSGFELVDSAAWGAVAERLRIRVADAWESLAGLEATRTRSASLTSWHAVTSAWRELDAQWSTLPGLWTAPPSDRVPRLVAWSMAAACVLESIDDARERLGAKRIVASSVAVSGPGTASPADTTKGWLVGLALAAAVAWGVWRLERGSVA